MNKKQRRRRRSKRRNKRRNKKSKKMNKVIQCQEDFPKSMRTSSSKTTPQS